MTRRRRTVTFWGTAKARRDYSFQPPADKAPPEKPPSREDFAPIVPQPKRRQNPPKWYRDAVAEVEAKRRRGELG